MIVDLILDRKDGIEYNPKGFYDSVTAYREVGVEIAQALDSGEEDDVKMALARYIVNNEYNPNIITYIYSVKWLPDE